MLLRRLAASTSSRVVGSVTQPSALTGSATASQSSALGPHSAVLILGIKILCVLLIAITLFIPTMVPPFLLLDRARFVLTLFMSLMFHLFLI
jgi:hypothetical protein